MLLFIIIYNGFNEDIIRRYNKHINNYNEIKYSYKIENIILKLYNMIHVVKIFKAMMEKYDEIDFKMLKIIDYNELEYDSFSLLNILEHSLNKKTPRRESKKQFIKRKYFYYNI